MSRLLRPSPTHPRRSRLGDFRLAEVRRVEARRRRNLSSECRLREGDETTEEKKVKNGGPIDCSLSLAPSPTTAASPPVASIVYRVSLGARFRHFRCHTPLSTLHPLPSGPYTCTRTTSGKPESILIVGTTHPGTPPPALLALSTSGLCECTCDHPAIASDVGVKRTAA